MDRHGPKAARQAPVWAVALPLIDLSLPARLLMDRVVEAQNGIRRGQRRTGVI